MSVGLLLAEFERIGDVPDAVPRLRRFVVGLAVAGRLSDQHSNEEPTEALAAMKSASAASEVPPNWVCAPLGDLIELQYGKGLPAAEREERGPVAIYGSNGSVARTNEALVEHPAIIVGRKGSAGALVLAEGPSWTTDVAYYIVPPPYFEIHFLFLALQALHLETLGKGVKPGLSRSDANPLPLAVPPLPEQRRIVAKVDELMSLCDQLEAAHAERELQRDALRSVSLHRLTESKDEPADVRFFLDKSPRLITKPEHVGAVRQTILDLAVRGRLVPQDLGDESASDHLRRSDQSRSAIALGDHRADIEQQPLLAAELRWAVPPHWEWRGLADLVLFIDYRGKTPTKVDAGVRLITAKNVRPGVINRAPEEFISEREYTQWMTRGLPQPGDVLFTTEAPMGNAAVVSTDEKFALAQRVIDFRSYGAGDPYFLALQLRSRPFQEILDKTATGLTAKGIKAAKLKRLPVVVPPLAEQHRIVAKVDELMGVCDGLEVALASAQSGRQRLLEAVLHEALNRGSAGDPVDTQD